MKLINIKAIMKPLIIILLILLLPIICQAQEIDLSIISTIESNNNPSAYNKHSQAIGLFQITDICRQDYNIQTKSTIPFKSLYNAQISTMIAKWYLITRIPQLLKHYNIQDTINNRLIAYNWGIGNLVKWTQKNGSFKDLPKETQNYITKYHKLNGS